MYLLLLIVFFFLTVSCIAGLFGRNVFCRKIFCNKKFRDPNVLIDLFLISILIMFTYLKYYYISILLLGFLIKKNSSFLYNLIIKYDIENEKFKKFYKKKFPILYYGLPIMILVSFLGIYLQIYKSNIIFNDIFFHNKPMWLEENELRKVSSYLTFFSYLFYFSIACHIAMTIYVVMKANDPIFSNGWRMSLIFIRITVPSYLAYGAALTIAAAPVEPNSFSQFVNVYLGKGWDFEEGDMLTKGIGYKIVQVTGTQYFRELVRSHCPTGIISNETLKKMVCSDKELYEKVLKKTSYYEKLIMGLPTRDYLDHFNKPYWVIDPDPVNLSQKYFYSNLFKYPFSKKPTEHDVGKYVKKDQDIKDGIKRKVKRSSK